LPFSQCKTLEREGESSQGLPTIISSSHISRKGKPRALRKGRAAIAARAAIMAAWLLADALEPKGGFASS